MDDLLGERLGPLHCLVMTLGFITTFTSNYSCLLGIFTTLLPYNCSSGTAVYDSHLAQGQSSSINVQYELCDQAISEMTSLLYFVGTVLGSVLVGPMSDLIGRVPTLIVGAIASSAANFTSNYCNVFWLHLTARCLSGCSAIVMQCAVMAYGNEILPQKFRSAFNSIWAYGFCAGGWAISFVAFYFKQHQTTGLPCCISPCTLLLLLAFLPESPLWLLESGRTNRAMHSLRRMSSIDRRALPSKERVEQLRKQFSKCSEESEQQQQHQSSLLHQLLKLDSRSKIDMGILLLYGFSITAANYGMFFSVSKVVTNVYLYTFLAFVVFVPAAALMSVFPRNRTLALTGISTCLFCLAIAALLFIWPHMPQYVGWAVLATGLCGVFTSGCGYSAMMAAGSERFPTAIRNTCMGLIYFISRFGSMAPNIVAFIPSFPLRIIVLVLPLLVTSWFAFVLPDTRKMQMLTTAVVLVADGQKEEEEAEADLLSSAEKLAVEEKLNSV